jgi:hypothetical protein
MTGERLKRISSTTSREMVSPSSSSSGSPHQPLLGLVQVPHIPHTWGEAWPEDKLPSSRIRYIIASDILLYVRSARPSLHPSIPSSFRPVPIPHWCRLSSLFSMARTPPQLFQIPFFQPLFLPLPLPQVGDLLAMTLSSLLSSTFPPPRRASLTIVMIPGQGISLHRNHCSLLPPPPLTQRPSRVNKSSR